jgi:hypothetical protein
MCPSASASVLITYCCYNKLKQSGLKQHKLFLKIWRLEIQNGFRWAKARCGQGQTGSEVSEGGSIFYDF